MPLLGNGLACPWKISSFTWTTHLRIPRGPRHWNWQYLDLALCPIRRIPRIWLRLILRCSPLSSRNLKVSDSLASRSYGPRPSVLHNSTTVNGTETFTDSGFIAITAVLNMVASTSKSSRRAIKHDVTDVVLDVISLRRVARHVPCVLYINCLFVH